MNKNDIKEAKKRVNLILNSKTEVKIQNKIPNESDFTFENGVKGWVSAIFVDMVDSSEIFKEEKDEVLARVLRAFTSETIKLLNTGHIRQIGIRGDCVYAIYTTPFQKDFLEVLEIAMRVNTLLKNVIQPSLIHTNFKNIKFGIGCAASKCLVIKTGQKGTGINDMIWIGDAVVDAANLSSLANHIKPYSYGARYGEIGLNKTFYINIIDQVKKWNNYSPNWFKSEKVTLGKKQEVAHFTNLHYII